MQDQWLSAAKVAPAMLRKRGYEEVDNYNPSNLEAEMKATLEPLLVALGRANTRPVLSQQEARVFFVTNEARISIKTIRCLQETHPNCLLILVSAGGATPFARKEDDVQVFELSSLTHDVTTHSLVPRHTVMTQTEIAMLTTSPKALPLLPTTDAISRFLDLRVDEVVKIDRRSRGGGLAGVTYFRRVCAPA